MHLVPGREFSSGSTDIIEACGRCWCTLADSVRLSSNKPWVSAPRRPSHLGLLAHSRPSMTFHSNRQPSRLGLMSSLAAELRKKRWLRQLGPAIVPLAIRIGVWSYVPMQNNWFDHGIQSERSGGLILTRHRDISGWTMVTLQKTLTVFLEDH